MPWNHSGQCPLWPMTVAHDHGYCCLQTKAVPGAVFEGASDGAVACNSRHHRVPEIAEIERSYYYFLPSHFFLKSISIWVLLFKGSKGGGGRRGRKKRVRFGWFWCLAGLSGPQSRGNWAYPQGKFGLKAVQTKKTSAFFFLNHDQRI